MKFHEETKTEQFNKKFWNRLQDEWKKISERAEDQPPWLSEFSEYYDPYKVSTIEIELQICYCFCKLYWSVSGIHFR